jgi:hypothetical protein
MTPAPCLPTRRPATLALVSALAVVGAALLLPARAQAAAGTIDLSWNACSPLVADLDPTGPGPLSLYASVIGHSDPHDGYEVWGYLGDADDLLPDAWAFQQGGCQGSSRFQVDHLPPAEVASACPAFQGDLVSLQIKAFQRATPSSGFPQTLGNFVIANVYPKGVGNPDPNQRQFLARFLFDHTHSVPGATSGDQCGGYERSLCFFLHPARLNYVHQGIESRFTPGQVFVTFRGECKSVPAAGATWGQIKGRYRR